MTLPSGPRERLLRGVDAVVRWARIGEFLFRRRDASGDIYPDDPDHAVVDGPEPYRVVFLGELGEISLGVRTHDLCLPAFFARRLAASTGRGVSWSVSGLPKGRIEGAPPVVASEPGLETTDVVVILIGITDTLRLLPSPLWEETLLVTVQALLGRLPEHARILISEIPPLDNAGSLSRPARVAAGVHGRLLNSRTVAATRDLRQVTVVPFPEELTQSVWRPDGEQNRYAATYTVWGRGLADVIAPRATPE
jgi:hypothetical protein